MLHGLGQSLTPSLPNDKRDMFRFVLTLPPPNRTTRLVQNGPVLGFVGLGLGVWGFGV